MEKVGDLKSNKRIKKKKKKKKKISKKIQMEVKSKFNLMCATIGLSFVG